MKTKQAHLSLEAQGEYLEGGFMKLESFGAKCELTTSSVTARLETSLQLLNPITIQHTPPLTNESILLILESLLHSVRQRLTSSATAESPTGVVRALSGKDGE